jgi:hypothetical protein
MDLLSLPFAVTDWADIPEETYRGETGTATWRTITAGTVRVRMVRYSAGYLADHWCERGHVVLVLSGELVTELQNGSAHRLTAGMSYQVGNGAPPHRSRTAGGALLFIVD